MTHRKLTAFAATLVATAASVLVFSPTPAEAQQTHVSPVPKETCCFTNFRYSGTCQVLPRQGQYCQNILSYLNNFSSTGESYCSTTTIRGGWTDIDCASGAAAGQVGFMKKQPIEIDRAGAVPITSPSRIEATTSGAAAPSELQVGDASVIQVRLERPLDGDNLVAGQELSGRLEADVLGPNGEVLAPAGAAINATVGAEQYWDSASAGQLQLQLVGTTTAAADLFGTAGDAVPSGEPATEAASLHLTGDLVELSEDSVLSFELKNVSEQPADLRVLTTATSVWMSAFNEGDAVTIAGLSSEDGALLPPNGRAVIGREAIYAYWQQKLTDSATRIELVNVETAVEGDLGYKAGRFEMLDPATGSSVDQGKYMQIWKRSPQGYWELHRDMWNSSRSSN